ncbi:MAG: nitroreductase family protein [Phycisphaerales bacterium]|nr:nitroreductase family protein [Phycisphaerales bacterium]
MDVIEAIRTRRSIRAYLDKPVPGDVIRQIIEAGILAPSGGNCQPWRFVVVTDREKIKQFDDEHHQPWVETAPAVIVACANPHDTWERYGEDQQCYILDVSAAMQNMLLAIHGLGLGGVWVAACSKRVIRKTLNIPDHWQIISIIPFGYFDAQSTETFNGMPLVSTKTPSRKPMSEVASFNDTQSPFTDESLP